MEDVEIAAFSMEEVEVTTLAAWFRLSLACLKTH